MEMPLAREARTIFRSMAIVVVLISAVLVYIFARVYSQFASYLTLLIHKIETACDCNAMAGLSMHPVIFSLIVFAGIATAVFIVYSLYQFIKLLRTTIVFSRKYLAGAKKHFSTKLNLAVAELGCGRQRITEVISREPIAFCYGFFRSKICVSTRLVKILHQSELSAVLLHEWQHASAREPLKLFIARYFQNIFSFLPGMTTLARKYITFSELAADEKATQGFTNRGELAGALLKISDWREKTQIKNELALSFFGLVIEDRVNQLADRDYRPDFRFSLKKIIGGFVFAVFLLATLFVFWGNGSKALAMHSIEKCTSLMGYGIYANCSAGNNVFNSCQIPKSFAPEKLSCNEH